MSATPFWRRCRWAGPCVLLATLALASRPVATGAEPAAAGGWRSFTAAWTATGERHSLRSGPREAIAVRLSGAFVVLSGEGLGKGFRADALGFDDGEGTSLGKMVLTDELGDQIFCTIRGSAVGAGQVFSGIITGGSGRHAGIEGEFSFLWQFVIRAEDGAFQGRAIDLKGRFRRPAAGSGRNLP